MSSTAERIVFQDGPIDGVILRPLKRFSDSRGWLIELFRNDELSEGDWPVMSYISQTLPGVARGPHEHRDQSDYFAFVGPGDFKLYLWDARPQSPTFRKRHSITVGESNCQAAVIPPGVIHAYKNISDVPGIVFNAPNRLYAGWGKKELVDEIRHEDVLHSPYALD